MRPSTKSVVFESSRKALTAGLRRFRKPPAVVIAGSVAALLMTTSLFGGGGREVPLPPADVRLPADSIPPVDPPPGSRQGGARRAVVGLPDRRSRLVDKPNRQTKPHGRAFPKGGQRLPALVQSEPARSTDAGQHAAASKRPPRGREFSPFTG